MILSIICIYCRPNLKTYISYCNKKTNDFNGLGGIISLKENINFINSFDLLNNYLIIQYKFTAISIVNLNKNMNYKYLWQY